MWRGERHCPWLSAVLPTSVFRHLLQGDKLRANNRPCLLYEFIQSVCILCFDAHTPGHHSKEDGARNNRLIKHLEHPIADTEGPELPHEVNLAQAFLVNCLRVCVLEWLLRGAGWGSWSQTCWKSGWNCLLVVHVPELLHHLSSRGRWSLSSHSIRPWCYSSPVCISVCPVLVLTLPDAMFKFSLKTLELCLVPWPKGPLFLIE